VTEAADNRSGPGDDSKHVVVLGAGMCGLYCARTLAAAGIHVTVLEKMDRPGGLAATMECDGNFFDLGVKHLHAHDGEIFQDIQGLMGDRLLPVALRAKIRFGNGFRQYPLKFFDLLTGIPPWTLAWILGGLFIQQIRNRFFPSPVENAEDALIELYGGPLYRYFFRDFTHRYWGQPPTKLSATFVRRKMPRLGAVDLLKQGLARFGFRAKQDTEVENALVEETLYYSHKGAIAIPEQFVTTIAENGGQVITSATVNRVAVGNNNGGENVTHVEYVKDGQSHTLTADYIVNTIPVPRLVDLLDATPANVSQAAAELRYRPLVVYGMVVNKPIVLDGLYIYYRERVFHRIAEPTQSGLKVDPPNHAVLLVEITCTEGDDIWKDTPAARDRVLADLAAENLVTPDQVVAMHHQCTLYGYPIFDLGFEPKLAAIMDHLDALGNIQSIGRQGGFCYPNMHVTMRQGAEAAERLIG